MYNCCFIFFLSVFQTPSPSSSRSRLRWCAGCSSSSSKKSISGLRLWLFLTWDIEETMTVSSKKEELPRECSHCLDAFAPKWFSKAKATWTPMDSMCLKKEWWFKLKLLVTAQMLLEVSWMFTIFNRIMWPDVGEKQQTANENNGIITLPSLVDSESVHLKDISTLRVSQFFSRHLRNIRPLSSS